MAPSIPEEIDVFTRPHGRMKELMNNFTKKMLHSDLSDLDTLLEVVSELHSTLLEFRRHEAIENVLILDRLKQRIRQNHKQPPPHLGHCHDDDALPKLFEFVRWCETSLGSCSESKDSPDYSEVGGKLHSAYTHFLQQFLPHMKLEEQEFQPLLMNHFEYGELKALKAEVWQQHQIYSKQNNSAAPIPPLSPQDNFSYPAPNLKAVTFLVNECKPSIILAPPPESVAPPLSIRHPACNASKTASPSPLQSSASNSPSRSSVDCGEEDFPPKTLSLCNNEIDLNRVFEKVNIDLQKQKKYSTDISESLFPEFNAKYDCQSVDDAFFNECCSADSGNWCSEAASQNSDNFEKDFQSLSFDSDDFAMKSNTSSVFSPSPDGSLTLSVPSVTAKCPRNDLNEPSLLFNNHDPFSWRNDVCPSSLDSNLSYDNETSSSLSSISCEVACDFNCQRNNSGINLLSLPREVLMYVLKFLNPQDLLRVASVCKELNALAYDGSFWRRLYPAQWAQDMWTWFDLQLASNIEDSKSLFSSPYASLRYVECDEDADTDTCEPATFSTRLRRVMEGLVAGVCRRLGGSVRVIVLDGAGSICSRTLNQMLAMCSNVTVLRAAYCSLDYLAFKGLGQHCGLGSLRVLDLQGCVRLDDDALQCISLCRPANKASSLTQLNISGCHSITNRGLDSLVSSGMLSGLQEADFSGCYRLSSAAVNGLVLGCRQLSLQHLAYCDNILQVEGEEVANGCGNVGNPLKFCCRSGA